MHFNLNTSYLCFFKIDVLHIILNCLIKLLYHLLMLHHGWVCTHILIRWLVHVWNLVCLRVILGLRIIIWHHARWRNSSRVLLRVHLLWHYIASLLLLLKVQLLLLLLLCLLLGIWETSLKVRTLLSLMRIRTLLSLILLIWRHISRVRLLARWILILIIPHSHLCRNHLLWYGHIVWSNRWSLLGRRNLRLIDH